IPRARPSTPSASGVPARSLHDALPISGLGPVDAMQRAHEVLYYVGLGEARYRTLGTYSTGMKQRIKLAQALVHDPDLLFLDEPRSEEHTSELQSRENLVCRLLLEKRTK